MLLSTSLKALLEVAKQFVKEKSPLKDNLQQRDHSLDETYSYYMKEMSDRKQDNSIVNVGEDVENQNQETQHLF